MKKNDWSPLAHLCLWQSPCNDFPDSYHEPSTRTAWALYHTVTTTHFKIPLQNTHICKSTTFSMFGLITLLCLGSGSTVHSGIIFAVEDSKPKYCGLSVYVWMCVDKDCVLNSLKAQRNLSSCTWHTFLLKQEALTPNAPMFRGDFQLATTNTLRSLPGREREREIAKDY